MPEWRYTLGGNALHAIDTSISVAARCGLTVWTYPDWMGTGSQWEYDRAAWLPLCKRCAAKVVESLHPLRREPGDHA